MSEDLNKLRELATKAADIAPGAWDHDTDNNDGAYGSGPDARHGFSSYFMMDDKGRRLFDSYNSEVAEVHEDDDSAWDENSRRLFDHLAAFNPATALSLIARVQAAEERAEKLEGALKGAAAYVDEAGGTCLALAMSGKDHPRLDELLMGLQAKSQAIAPTLRTALKTEGA